MSAAILRVSVALGVCAALINLLVWHQPIMEMANGHTSAFRVLYAMWFVLAWGVATGALTGLAISSMRRRSPGRLSAAVAFVLGLFLTSTVCLVLYRGFADAKFMYDAMSGLHPGEVDSYSPICMNPARTRLNVAGALRTSLRSRYPLSTHLEASAGGCVCPSKHGMPHMWRPVRDHVS